MENDPEVLKAVLSGKHDNILKDTHPEAESYKKAIRYIKHKYGKSSLEEMVKKIPPLDQRKVDQEIRRHGKADDYTTPNPLQRVIRPRGYPEAEFKHGPHTIQMTHVPLEKKFIFHHVPTGHPVAIARYEKNSAGVIDKIDQTKSSDYTQPALMLKAFQAIKSKHPVKLDPNKMIVTPQGQRAVDILKKRKQLEEGKLLDKPTRSLEQIAQKHNWSIDKMSRQLKRGIEVEKEHTSHSHVAREIALDHLWEKPDYYLKLSKMENNE